MCSASGLIVLYICVNSLENILDGIRVMERTQMMEVLTDGTQNFGGYIIIPSPLFVAGHKKEHNIQHFIIVIYNKIKLPESCYT